MDDLLSDGQEGGIWIDGTLYTDEDLTYREQREVRKLVKEANSDDPAFDPRDAAPIDILPAVVTVIKQREDPDFSWEQALDLKPTDLRKPEETPDDEAEQDPPTAPPEREELD